MIRNLEIAVDYVNVVHINVPTNMFCSSALLFKILRAIIKIYIKSLFANMQRKYYMIGSKDKSRQQQVQLNLEFKHKDICSKG